MPAITIQAHYDGRSIHLEEPVLLAPNARLLVTLLEPTDDTRADWASLAADGLARAFGDDESECGPDDLQHR